MNITAWLIRAKRWSQNPPSAGRVTLVFSVIAICLVIYGFERVFGWPDWLVPNRLNAKP